MFPQLIELLGTRYSCRSYSKAPVSDNLINGVLEAARIAPSACNRQPWTFIVVRDENTRRTMLAKSRPSFIDAPVVIVACADHNLSWHRPADNKDHADIDLAIAIDHITLAATALELGTCWVCSFDTVATRDILRLPDNIEPVALIPIGFAAEDEHTPIKSRKSLEEIVKCEHF